MAHPLHRMIYSAVLFCLRLYRIAHLKFPFSKSGNISTYEFLFFYKFKI